MNYIKGKYKRSIYRSDAGYTVGLFRVSETNDVSLESFVNKTITFTGYFPPLNDFDVYTFYGSLTSHEKYGKQYAVTNFDVSKPATKNSIVEFLSSGLFKGIGEKKAQKIVDVLGKDTINVIVNNPSNLALIPTITAKNIDILHEKLKNYANYDTVIKLNELGFSVKEATAITNSYKEKTNKIIEENIYDIAFRNIDIPFKKVDSIATHNNIDLCAPIRIEAGIVYVMQEVADSSGHCYFYEEELYKFICRLFFMDIATTSFKSCLANLQKQVKVIKIEERYYLKEMIEAEEYIVNRIKLLNTKEKTNTIINDRDLKELESYTNIKYNKEQLEAIKESLINNITIITGGPGTGKTTILKGITKLYQNINKLTDEHLQEDIALLAPTGRAAKRMSEEAHLSATTIHRFLKWNKDNNTFAINEYNKSKVKLIIIDEASMIDVYLLASLFKGISVYCHIIIIGDDHQLPSVGPGQVLHDLIESQTINTYTLERLYRQKDDSNIISLAYDVRENNDCSNDFNKGKDVIFDYKDSIDVINEVLEYAKEYQDKSYKDFQVLVPMYKGINGIDNLNLKLQNIFNPKDIHKKEILIGEVLYREGDKVIQLTNMPDESISNGDIGLIYSIKSKGKKEIYIDFDGNMVRYTTSNFYNFKQAYAISIHKSQGSEFDYVIIPIVKSYNKMLYKKLIYTAITRCKKKLIIVGEEIAFNMALKNNYTDTRRSSIKELLIGSIKT